MWRKQTKRVFSLWPVLRLSFRGRRIQDCADLIAVEDLARRAVGALHPFREFAQPHFVLDADVGDRHAYNLPLGRFGRPIIASQRGQSLGNSFIKRCRSHFHGVSDSLDIPDGDAARTNGHGAKISYSLFLRHSRDDRAEVGRASEEKLRLFRNGTHPGLLSDAPAFGRALEHHQVAAVRIAHGAAGNSGESLAEFAAIVDQIA